MTGTTMGGGFCPRCGLYAYVTLKSPGVPSPSIDFLNRVHLFILDAHEQDGCRPQEQAS